MSKKVEAAIKRIRNTIVYLGRKSGKTRCFEDINLIIEQAERVWELERQVSRYKARLESIANYINTQNELDCYKEEGEE